MPKRYFTITKEVTFQGHAERFSNVYLYDMSTANDTTMNAQIDSLIAAERPVFSSSVNFVEARCFTTEGLNGAGDAGVTYVVRPISATAGTNVQAGIYRELAFLCKWELPRKVLGGGALGRQRSLKKWLHTCSSMGISAGSQGEAAIFPVTPTAIANYMAAVTTMNGSPMIAPDGSLPVLGTGVLHQYLEHRQFPRGRKET